MRNTHEMGNDVMLASLAGLVGDGPALEYVAFRKTYLDLPDPMEIYKGKNIVPGEPSVLFALCSAMTYHIKDAGQTLGISMQAIIDRLLEYSQKLDAEFAGLMIRDAYVTYRPEMIKSKLWVKIAQRYF